MQRSRSKKKGKPDDRTLAHTHSQISSPPCIHHSFSPWALYSLSSTLGCQCGRLVRSDKGRICLCPLVPIELFLYPLESTRRLKPARLPLGPTRLGRQTPKNARGPGGSGVVGGRGEQKTENEGEPGGPALRIRPRRETEEDLDDQISKVGFKTKVPRLDHPRCPGICSRSQNR